jgi:hypothetical protein
MKINTYIDMPMDFFTSNTSSQSYTSSLAAYASITIDLDYRMFSYPELYKVIPSELNSHLDCSPILPNARYLWWRSLSSTFMLRPNNNTLNVMAENRKVPLRSQDYCIAVYVRHGDKGGEMKLVDTHEYIRTIEDLLRNGFLPKKYTNFPPSINRTRIEVSRNENVYNGTIFLGTDDPDALELIFRWGVSKNIDIQFTTILNRTEQLRHQASAPGVRHELEYISYLINLEYALKCEAWICTYASNTCGIIDDLRVTVAGKANRAYGDLSRETCSLPPCWNSSNAIFNSR